MPRKWKRGVGPNKRGRHKRWKSRETRRWNQMMRQTSQKDQQ